MFLLGVKNYNKFGHDEGD